MKTILEKCSFCDNKIPRIEKSKSFLFADSLCFECMSKMRIAGMTSKNREEWPRLLREFLDQEDFANSIASAFR
jgi:hypothetical protein